MLPKDRQKRPSVPGMNPDKENPNPNVKKPGLSKLGVLYRKNTTRNSGRL